MPTGEGFPNGARISIDDFELRPQTVVDVDDPIELEGVWELNKYDSRGRGRGERITMALVLA